MRFLAIVPFMLVAGCASPVSAPRPDVVTVDHLPLNATILRRVSETVCAPGPFDKAPANAEALAALQAKVAGMGADGLYRVTYANTGLIGRCGAFPGRTATGLLYRRGT